MISELPQLVHDIIIKRHLDVAGRIRLGSCSTYLWSVYCADIAGACSPRRIVIPLGSWARASAMASSSVLPTFSSYALFMDRFSRKEQQLRKRNLSFGKYWNSLETLLDHDASKFNLNISVHFVFFRRDAMHDSNILIDEDSTLDDVSAEFSGLPVKYVMERLLNSIHMTIRLDNDRVLTNEFFMSDEGPYQSYFEYTTLPLLVTFRHVYTPIILGECSIWHCFTGVVERMGPEATSSGVCTYVSVDLSAPSVVASSESDLVQCCLEMFIFKCILSIMASCKPVRIYWAPTGVATLDNLLERHLGTTPIPRTAYFVVTPVHTRDGQLGDF